MTIHGDIVVGGENLQTRDAIGISETPSFEIKSNENSGILFIEVPMIF